MNGGGSTTRRIAAFASGATRACDDVIAVEEPLEIRAGGRAVSVTMRTPGHDAELAVGFLATEGILRSAGDVLRIGSRTPRNCVDVEVSEEATRRLPRVARNFYVASSCGICGKASIEAIRTVHGVDLDEPMSLPATLVLDLPRRLRSAQNLFDATGGLHAAALFDATGTLVCAREDVGRHNAVDKVIGERFLAGQLPASGHVLVVSGRASFELVQKAAMARVPVLVAVGAPSSLAIDLAEEVGMTLVGFVRGERFNVYAGEERIAGLDRPEAEATQTQTRAGAAS